METVKSPGTRFSEAIKSLNNINATSTELSKYYIQLDYVHSADYDIVRVLKEIPKDIMANFVSDLSVIADPRKWNFNPFSQQGKSGYSHGFPLYD